MNPALLAVMVAMTGTPAVAGRVVVAAVPVLYTALKYPRKETPSSSSARTRNSLPEAVTLGKFRRREAIAPLIAAATFVANVASVSAGSAGLAIVFMLTKTGTLRPRTDDTTAAERSTIWKTTVFPEPSTIVNVRCPFASARSFAGNRT